MVSARIQHWRECRSVVPGMRDQALLRFPFALQGTFSGHITLTEASRCPTTGHSRGRVCTSLVDHSAGQVISWRKWIASLEASSECWCSRNEISRVVGRSGRSRVARGGSLDRSRYDLYEFIKSLLGEGGGLGGWTAAAAGADRPDC